MGTLRVEDGAGSVCDRELPVHRERFVATAAAAARTPHLFPASLPPCYLPLAAVRVLLAAVRVTPWGALRGGGCSHPRHSKSSGYFFRGATPPVVISVLASVGVYMQEMRIWLRLAD